MERSTGYTPEDVTHRMILTNQMHRRMVEGALDGTGLHRAQHRILMVISCHEFCSQVELARHLEVTPATIAISLKAMERDGLIRRKAKKEDGRVNFVELTARGRRIVKESKNYFDYINSQMYQGFSKEERMKLCDFLDRIYENMERVRTDGVSVEQAVLNKNKEKTDGTV